MMQPSEIEIEIEGSGGRADSKVKCNTLGFNERGWNVAGC
jgi:hypothetical protein